MMRVILTHEQADFDALASLLGVFLLDETARPVLPRRMNRNVRAFVTLYGAELPFIDARDLPQEGVESICLVDTQSMATIRGVGQATRVHIIDHHAQRGDLPAGWTITTEDVGATATLLVEQLREHNGNLSMVHATLMLLGIYEDTGSLTYSRTTSRDLQAATYLLEQGANLRIATDFLNHPLSLQQQAIYDELRRNLESQDIHGYTIVIACGAAQDLDEELSTIAHKLRDLLDPDALFVLVTTRGGVQLICRSTTDNIDVAEVAARFGGGGHSRAAASLIKGRGIDDVYVELVRILPDFVRPAITVAEIMSSGPQVLAPETPVHEAAERMQRYGYEGYPVVQGGKVVGLLTRRAVDRALAHKLNLTAASLMNAGEVVVRPDDSIDHLQRLMTDTGWGQVPVVDPKSGTIVGIVTRTDVLKTLTSHMNHPGRMNIAEKLEDVLPPARLALLEAASEIAYGQHAALYIVGGFVRDLLMDRPSLDFDLVTEGDAITLANTLNSRLGGRLTTHSRFGTAKWLIDKNRSEIAAALGFPGCAAELPEFLDLISARTEFYTHPTALPTVERGSIKLDLQRRDFTINTLALRLDGSHYGELHDHWGGLNDLRDGLVRVLHSLSFVDDPTRMLRAVRFEQRFGFNIEGRTLELLHEALSLIGRVSGDRIRHEMDHVLDEERHIYMLDRLEELNLLTAIHPDLKWDDWVKERIQSLSSFGSTTELELQIGSSPGFARPELQRHIAYILWLLRTPINQQKAILGRLKFPHTQAEDIYAASRLWHDLPSLASRLPSAIVARMDEAPLPAIYANYIAVQDTRTRNIIRDYLLRWRKITPITTGYDLQALGISPGPIYRHILGTLRKAWLDGSVTKAEEETELLNRLLIDEGMAGKEEREQ
jgi:tRNA nucleotidyltransferase (CCA-adding enzyme)